MISKLSGLLDSVSEGYLILNVQGVGYQVYCSSKTLSQCTGVGEPLSLLIDTHVREDYIHLFGFLTASEQAWFRLLIGVQGVGAKAAMAILTVCPPEQIGFAIAAGDKAALTRADGVGPKLGARLVTELKDKAGKMVIEVPIKTTSAGNSNSPIDIPVTQTGADQDAVSALINLGYQRTDAYTAVMQVKQKAENDNQAIELSDIIRLALQELSL